MQNIVEKDIKPEVDEILDFLSQLNDEEKKAFKSFMDGVKFVKKNDEQGSVA